MENLVLEEVVFPKDIQALIDFGKLMELILIRFQVPGKQTHRSQTRKRLGKLLGRAVVEDKNNFLY